MAVSSICRRAGALLALLAVVVIGGAGTASAQPAGSALAGAYFKVVNQNSGKCLDVRREDPKPLAGVQQYRCTGTDNQLWTAVSTGDGYSYLVSKESGLCMQPFLFTVTVVNTCSGATGQQWRAVPAGFEWNELRSRLLDQQCLWVVSSSVADSVATRLAACDGSAAQHWQFVTV
ncbi:MULTISPECIES: RICIN domain-containing protein [unclassified Streptomyces]|uniref:RICIN domain-containing protein n=1 Tax=unclassified Streptomyces TaxID=2593676 RepID=UPI00190BD489|nr:MULTISPECIES: RICIN domain-containing protein [unclassified Streptomyces]MBK3565914.1 RICIN domain-containing protein [Streptomyces sp. MBT62]MBK6013579.1 RICIN domain-containing protein [Streptomyces sp. MBT53]